MKGQGMAEAIHEKKPIPGRAVAAVAIGNFLEFYDFIVYAFFAVMIGKAFFPAAAVAPGMSPAEAEWIELLAAVAVFGAGFVTRPIGAAVIGAYADRVGRKAALTFTLLLMAVGTAIMAFTPGYAQIGIAAPVLLVIGRLIQGFSAGGEVGPATTYLLEAAPPERRASMTAWQGITQMLAGAAGSGLGLVLAANLSEADLYEWGWRVPFVIGLLVAPVGLYVRMTLPETLETTQAHDSGWAVLRTLFAKHWGAVILAVLCIVGPTVSTYVSGYMTTYAIQALNQPPAVAMYLTFTGYIAGIAGIPIGAWIADRTGARIAVVVPRALFCVIVFPAYQGMTAAGATVDTLTVINVGLNFLLALANGGLYVLITQVFPMAVRSSGLSIGYALAVTIFGGSTQYLVTKLIAATGDPMVPAYYQVVANVVSILAIMAIPASAEVGRAARLNK
jgi:MFS family permease